VEAVTLVRVGFIDRCTHEGVVVVDSDLGQIAGVVADGDRASDERGERGREVALTLEVDPVALDGAVLGNSQKQPVELLETLRESWQPPLGDPGRLRARADRGVRALVVLVDELPDGPIEPRQVQHRQRVRVPPVEAPGQGRQHLGVDGVEEPLDLPPALRTGDRGVDDADLQGDRGVL
jgi:hypothetical protein